MSMSLGALCYVTEVLGFHSSMSFKVSFIGQLCQHTFTFFEVLRVRSLRWGCEQDCFPPESVLPFRPLMAGCKFLVLDILTFCLRIYMKCALLFITMSF